MVRIGIVGVGFMGWIHWLATKKIKGAKVTAICTRDEKKLKGDWRAVKGNFGPKGERVDLTGIAGHRSIDEIVADPNVDMVDICLPTHLHVEATLKALAAGKHVLLEKPIALDVADGKKLIAAAKKAGKLLMVAQVLPFFPDWAFALQTVKSGEFGKLQAAHFRRLISRPDWSAEMGDASKTGGPAIDLHIHDTHFIQLLCGSPKQVYSRGVDQGGHVLHMETTYLYDGPDAPVVTCSSGSLSQSGQAFTAGFELYLEGATLLQDFATLGGKPVLSKPLTMITGAKVKNPKLPGGDPIDSFADEIGTAVKAVQENTPAAALSAEGALTALVLCHKEIQSVRTGKPVKV